MMAPVNPLIQLDEAGTSVWLDYIRRELVHSGELKRMVEQDGLRGLTSNPTIFEKAISGSQDYDRQVQALTEESKTPLEIFQVLATDDIRDACDVLRPLYEDTNRRDGFVSIEVSPAAASDAERTLSEARHLWQLVDRPNVMIKVPGTSEGLDAVETLLYEGINVNITLLFSVERYGQVAERFIRAVERRHADGQPIAHVASVASFFVSRVDSAIDKQLQKLIERPDAPPDAKDLLGKAAIANARLAYEGFEEMFSSERWKRLEEAGAQVQRPLWASTSTKNAQYRDVMYVEQLIGPHTVNTMPQATLNAFKDHGNVARTIDLDMEAAHEIRSRLKAIGIDLDDVTRNLEIDGVRLFSESFDQLIEAITSQQRAIRAGKQRKSTEILGSYSSQIEQVLERLDNEHFCQRLWEKDPTLWSADPQEQQQVRTALGWMTVAERSAAAVDDLVAFAKQVGAGGFEDVVVLGMGGSSLCPDVIAHTFQRGEGYPRLSVLDTTSPEAISAVTARLDIPKTMFVVSSKSGTTTEPLAFFEYFWSLAGRDGDDPSRQFIAITDPDTPLEQEAKRRNFRKIFPGDAEIGGRYSALSNFGLVPAVLMGIDIRQLLDRAEGMVQATHQCVKPSNNPGVRLGVIIGELARMGRDKLTFIMTPQVSTFGWWLEQLIAESTGKSGTGIVPVDGEQLTRPDIYNDDRVFVSIRLADDEDSDRQQALNELAQAGHPVVEFEIPDEYDLGAQVFLWEIATATAGHILQINAFNQPNVQESKDNTKELLAVAEQEGSLPTPHPHWAGSGLSVASPLPLVGDSLLGLLDQFVTGSRTDRSYVAVMAYVPPTARHDALLEKVRVAIRDKYRVATTVGYGPRFLHSTGQLHKGGPDEGVFVQIVCDTEQDLAAGTEPFTFGTLISAQSLGDYKALHAHNRPVLRIDLGDAVANGLRILASALEPTSAVV